MTFSDVVAGLDTNMFQPAPVAWLWDAAGRLEINWKLSCHEKHILGDTKKWLFSVQAVFLFLIYFKQYLFAVKSKRLLWIFRIHYYVSWRSLAWSFLFAVLCLLPQDRSYIFSSPLLRVYFHLHRTLWCRQEMLVILGYWEEHLRGQYLSLKKYSAIYTKGSWLFRGG